MNWLLRLYPPRWRMRCGEEFAVVLAGQSLSLGLILDVIGGAVDAWLSPQIQSSTAEQTRGEMGMTRAMFDRCNAGGPKLSPSERRLASRMDILGALVMAALYLLLTKIYRGAPAVQAVFYTSACSSFA